MRHIFLRPLAHVSSFLNEASFISEGLWGGSTNVAPYVAQRVIVLVLDS